METKDKVQRNYALPFYLAAFALVIMLFHFFNCPPAEETPTNTDPLKKEVQTLKKEKAIVSANSDTIFIQVVKWKTKYQTVRHDSLIPCEEKLQICDTIIVKDSLLISNQAKEINLSNQIIAKMDTVIHLDSLTISGLKKEVKKEKRLKIFFGVLAAVAAGIGVAR